MTKQEDGGAAHTPTPWKDRGKMLTKQLRGMTSIGHADNPAALVYRDEDAAFLLLAVNSHAALVKVAEMVLAARDNGDETALVEAAQSALLTHRRETAKQE